MNTLLTDEEMRQIYRDKSSNHPNEALTVTRFIVQAQEAHTKSELAKAVTAILNPYSFEGKAFQGYELQYNAVESTKNAILKLLETK